MLISYITTVKLTRKKINIKNILLTKLQTLFKFHMFFHCPFPVTGYYSGSHIAFNCKNSHPFFFLLFHDLDTCEKF